MKKKLGAIIISCMMIAGLTACGGSASGQASAAKAEVSSKAAAAETTLAAKVSSASAEMSSAAAKAGSQASEAVSSAAAAASKITDDGVVTKGTLVMATNAEFPPYEYHDNNQIVGIDADIMAAVADKMGCKLQIEDVQFDSIIPEITSGKADIGAAGITVTDDRKQSVDFSDTYAHASQVIIVKSDSTIAGPDDLSGKTVGVQQGTTGDIYVSDEKDVTVERYNKGMEAVQALSQGKIDAVVIDGEPAKVFVKEVSGLKTLDKSYTDEDYAIAIKKGNTKLLTNINAALKELKSEGKLDEIIKKYIKSE